uniref:UmuC domain-containing protein n=1 Tax=Parastrongyloides trichosuri TaxID=131310 RepID=A0A0N4ZYD2_PARTI
MFQSTYRFIALLDVDAFFAQAEQVLDPTLRGKPVVVLQSMEYSDGQVIALSYEAKALGLKRGMKKREVVGVGPHINIRKMPLSTNSSSSDRTKYEMESMKIFNVLKEFANNTTIEKASIDEMYFDLTDHVNDIMKNSFDDFLNKMLKDNTIFERCYLASINDINEDIEEGKRILMERFSKAVDEDDKETVAFYIAFYEVYRLRMLIKEKTNYETSVGVSYSKKISKYVCKRHRPFSMTLMLPEEFNNVFGEAKITEITGFGGKLGEWIVDKLGVETIKEVNEITDLQLCEHFSPDEIRRIRSICHGGINDEVKARSRNSDLSCSKTFRDGCSNIDVLQKHLEGIAKDFQIKLNYERDHCKREPTSFSLNYNVLNQYSNVLIKRKVLAMRGHNYESYLPKIAINALKEMADELKKTPIICIGFTASKFEDISKKIPITNFFTKVGETRKRKVSEEGSLESEKKRSSLLLKDNTKKMEEILISDDDEEVNDKGNEEVCKSGSQSNESEQENLRKQEDSDDDIQVIKVVRPSKKDAKKSKKKKMNNKDSDKKKPIITKQLKQGRGSIEYYFSK